MSGKSNRASGKGDKARRQKKPLDLPTARRMLPLVQRIVNDIVLDHTELNRFTFEQEGLDRDKRNLSWPERQRRYAVQGEVVRLQTRIEEEALELDRLGAIIVNPTLGQIGFPTLINGRPAYFSWKLGEDGVEFWHFDGEQDRRPIPPNWSESSQIRLVGLR
ncbi:MAG: DUF2203 domain-containing protein [Gemmataceae bacterium]